MTQPALRLDPAVAPAAAAAVRRRLRGLAASAAATRTRSSTPSSDAPAAAGFSDLDRGRRGDGAARRRARDEPAPGGRRARAARAHRPRARARRGRPRPARLRPPDRDGVGDGREPPPPRRPRPERDDQPGELRTTTARPATAGSSRETGTRWVRMWADWPTLMPDAGGFDAAIIGSLDAQIALPGATALRIVLTLYRFPTWANGTPRLTPGAARRDDARPQDTATQTDTSAKSLLFRYPDDVTPGSAWGDFVDRIAPVTAAATRRARRSTRRRRARDRQRAEPAVVAPAGPERTTRPTRSAPGRIVVHDVLARMFATAKTIARARRRADARRPGGGGLDGGDRQPPAHRLRHARRTACCRRSRAAGSRRAPRFAWTHHNYTDVTFDQGAGHDRAGPRDRPARATNFAADMRRRLIAGRWAGWPAGDRRTRGSCSPRAA